MRRSGGCRNNRGATLLFLLGGARRQDRVGEKKITPQRQAGQLLNSASQLWIYYYRMESIPDRETVFLAANSNSPAELSSLPSAPRQVVSCECKQTFDCAHHFFHLRSTCSQRQSFCWYWWRFGYFNRDRCHRHFGHHRCTVTQQPPFAHHAICAINAISTNNTVSTTTSPTYHQQADISSSGQHRRSVGHAC